MSVATQSEGLKNDQRASGGSSELRQLEDVAEQFEALFVQSFLSSARSAQLADPLLNNEGTQTFNSMLDREYASALAKRESLGIAEGLVKQFKDRLQGKDES
jgi:flagellar protein FlgJ